MARTKGAIGKPKTFFVSLKDMNIVFNPDAIIEISIKYYPLFNKSASNEELKNLGHSINNKEEVNKVQFEEI